jgi:hypothetical protein
MTAFLNSCKGLIRSFVAPSPMPRIEMEVDEPEKKGLFAPCSFLIVRSGGLTDDDAEKVCVLSQVAEFV